VRLKTAAQNVLAREIAKCLKAPKARSARLRQMSVYPSFDTSNGDNVKYAHRNREMVRSS